MSEKDRMERAGDINRDFISKYMKQIREKMGWMRKWQNKKGSTLSFPQRVIGQR